MYRCDSTVKQHSGPHSQANIQYLRWDHVPLGKYYELRLYQTDAATYTAKYGLYASQF